MIRSGMVMLLSEMSSCGVGMEAPSPGIPHTRGSEEPSLIHTGLTGFLFRGHVYEVQTGERGDHQ
jgi:hypothetical protein